MEQVRGLFEAYGDDIAAVIIEPVAGNMGVVKAEDQFMETLRVLCDEYGSLLIFDEVMSGFRVAYKGAQSLFNVKPDLITLTLNSQHVVRKVTKVTKVKMVKMVSTEPMELMVRTVKMALTEPTVRMVNITFPILRLVASTSTRMAKSSNLPTFLTLQLQKTLSPQLGRRAC